RLAPRRRRAGALSRRVEARRTGRCNHPGHDFGPPSLPNRRNPRRPNRHRQTRGGLTVAPAPRRDLRLRRTGSSPVEPRFSPYYDRRDMPPRTALLLGLRLSTSLFAGTPHTDTALRTFHPP